MPTFFLDSRMVGLDKERVIEIVKTIVNWHGEAIEVHVSAEMV